MGVFICDAVRTIHGKAKPDGGLTSLKPEELAASRIAVNGLEFDHANGQYGLVVLAGASGIGTAMIVERFGDG